MKLTQKLKAEILKVYNEYWDSFFDGDMRTFASMLDESVQIIGSSENEVFSNKASAVRFYKATSGQVTGKTALRNRKISMRLIENSVIITEQSDFYALIDDAWGLYGHGRISTLMRNTGKAWKIIYEHGSLPDSKAGEGEQINTERIKAENLQLREAVKRRTIELEQKNRRLEQAKKEIEVALENLKKTQQQLITQEKLASLGQLTAGIAHEIKNPLNFVNNFAALSVNLAAELREEIAKVEDRGTPNADRESLLNIAELLNTLELNAQKISHHGRRADSIVKSMMQHARSDSGKRQMTDINRLLDEAVDLVYHGLRANDASFHITIEKQYDESIGKLEVVSQDLRRVFLNIVNNGCYAAHQRARMGAGEDGRIGDGNSFPIPPVSDPPVPAFSPALFVSTKSLKDKIEIRIRDNGTGIPVDIRKKIFDPFFTTKPAGQGTGLGLSISHDIIVQEHKGEIEVETEEGQFAEFVLRLPAGG